MPDELDAIDRRILGVLQKDSRITNAELSERVNLSPSACHRRVHRLEEDGFIAAYVALLDARKMEVARPSFSWKSSPCKARPRNCLTLFEREVARVPDILECHLMAGAADYLIKIMAEDTEDFGPHPPALSCPACPACGKCNPPSRCAPSCRPPHWPFDRHADVT